MLPEVQLYGTGSPALFSPPALSAVPGLLGIAEVLQLSVLRGLRDVPVSQRVQLPHLGESSLSQSTAVETSSSSSSSPPQEAFPHGAEHPRPVPPPA